MAGPVFSATAMAFGGAGASPLPAVVFNFANGQRLAVATTSVQSAAINSPVVAVKSVDTAFWVTVGANPTAAVGGTSWPVALGETLFLPITPGQLVAVITTGSGNVSVMPCG